MSNETIYSALFKGLKFKNVPSVTGPLLQALQTVAEDAWVTQHLAQLQKFQASRCFAELLSYAFSDRQLGELKFECLTSRFAKVTYQGTTLEFDIIPKKAAKADVMNAVCLKLLDSGGWPLIKDISPADSECQSAWSIPMESVVESVIGDDLYPACNEQGFTPSLSQPLFGEFESEDSEDQIEAPNVQANFQFNKDEWDDPVPDPGEHQQQPDPIIDQKKPELVLNYDKTRSLPTPLENDSFIKRALSTNEGTTNEEPTLSAIKRSISDPRDPNDRLNPRSTIINNEMFKENLSGSGVSTPTPGRKDAFQTILHSDYLPGEEPTLKMNWQPPARLTISSIFEEQFFKKYVESAQIEAIKEEQPYTVHHRLEIKNFRSSWFDTDLVQKVKEGLKALDFCFIMVQHSSKVKEKTNIKAILRPNRGMMCIQDSLASSLLSPQELSRLAVYRFLRSYFPLVAAKLAKNTIERILAPAIPDRSLEVSSMLSHQNHREADNFATKAEKPLEFANEKLLSDYTFSLPLVDCKFFLALRAEYESKNKAAIACINTDIPNCTMIQTTTALQKNFSYELVHTPSADLVKCKLFPVYLEYKNSVKAALESSREDEDIKNNLDKARGVVEACDFTTSCVLKEILLMRVMEDGSILYFMSSPTPKPICQIKLKRNATLKPDTLLSYGCMILMRLIAKPFYDTMKLLWQKQTEFFA